MNGTASVLHEGLLRLVADGTIARTQTVIISPTIYDGLKQNTRFNSRITMTVGRGNIAAQWKIPVLRHPDGIGLPSCGYMFVPYSQTAYTNQYLAREMEFIDQLRQESGVIELDRLRGTIAVEGDVFCFLPFEDVLLHLASGGTPLQMKRLVFNPPDTLWMGSLEAYDNGKINETLRTCRSFILSDRWPEPKPGDLYIQKDRTGLSIGVRGVDAQGLLHECTLVQTRESDAWIFAHTASLYFAPEELYIALDYFGEPLDLGDLQAITTPPNWLGEDLDNQNIGQIRKIDGATYVRAADSAGIVRSLRVEDA